MKAARSISRVDAGTRDICRRRTCRFTNATEHKGWAVSRQSEVGRGKENNSLVFKVEGLDFGYETPTRQNIWERSKN
jgi:hypothetical protein